MPDGGWILRSRVPLEPHERSLGEMLRRWATDTPDRVFIAERDADEAWRTVSYGEARVAADAIAQALLDRALGAERPLAILSENSVDHALLTLGALTAGVPVAPISPAYSLMSRDFARLRQVVDLLRPGLVYAADDRFAPALAAVGLEGVEVVTSERQHFGEPPSETPRTRGRRTSFAELLATPPGPAVDDAFRRVGPDTVAKVLFTSGSTAAPKGVINTHRMLCANQQMLAQVWPFTEASPPVLVDWLPWSHTFGGNHNFNLVLKRGGSMYIDAGRPTPALAGISARNLAEVSPTISFNVPAGYAALLPLLEAHEALAEGFFRRLQLIFYAAAALPQDVWERLERLAERTLRRRVPMTSSWGSTETAPLATAAHFPADRAGIIGVPVPGVTIRMVPCGDKLELRVKGPNVTPGYLGRPDLTAAAFDAEGFYRIGDAGRFADPRDPAKGLLFDGRVAEDFKLSTGTWVSVGGVRVAAIAAAAPLLRDVVVAGHDRERIGLLAWVDHGAAAAICGLEAADVAADDVIRRPEVAAHVRAGLVAHNAARPGLSTRVPASC
jgi:feruloyl-CoA synthase